MEVKFELYGLQFTAQVDYTPSDPGKLTGRWEDAREPWPEEIIITDLKSGESDAMFLASSELVEEIIEAISDEIASHKEE